LQQEFFATGMTFYCHRIDKLGYADGCRSTSQGATMDQAKLDKREYDEKLDELDHLLNDPEVALEPGRVWSLLAELTRHDLSAGQPKTA
jgi:hypothetical protein